MGKDFSFNRYLNNWDGVPVIQYYEGSNYVYVPIPKCGSSTMLNRFGIKKYPFNTKENINNIDKIKFTIVRNPYSRLLSAWYGKIKNQLGSGITNIEGFNYDMSFKEFLLAVNNLPNHLCDEHFAPITTILKNVKIDHIIKVESLNDEYEKLIKKYNLPQRYTNMAITNIGEKYMDFFDDEMYKIVNKKYYDDFKIYNYEIITKNK